MYNILKLHPPHAFDATLNLKGQITIVCFRFLESFLFINGHDSIQYSI